MATTEAKNRTDTDATLRSVDKSTGFSLFHILSIGSIIGSIFLFLSGRKQDGIFVGLWAPTFEALRSGFEKD